MPTNDDYLDRLWNEVVNIDPEGKWIERGIEVCRPLKKGPYSKCAAALERLRALNAVEDLGRVSRESRFTACFDLLCSIEDPGLSTRKLPQVYKLLNEFLLGKVSPPKSVAEFWKSRMEVMLDPKDDGKWLVELTKPNRSKGEFGDVGPAVKRLRKAGATFGDLGCLTAWSRYEASLQALQLLAESGLLEEESLDGLHEVFLDAEPSGTEAGPKSWPLPKKPALSARQKAESGDDPTKPLWKVRSGQAVAISPDSKTVAVAGASGPVRLLDAATGNERLVCEGLKAHICEIAFSPDGKLVAAAQIRQWVTICDAATGKLVAKAKLSDEEVSGLVFSSKTGELIRSSWCNAIEIIDPATGKVKESLRPSGNSCMTYCIAFSPSERELVAVWDGRCTVWSWPDRVVRNEFEIPDCDAYDASISPDGQRIAVPFRHGPKGIDEGLHLIDLWSGKVVRTLSMSHPRSVIYSSEQMALIASGDDYDCRIFGAKNYEERLQLSKVGDVTGFDVSPDGKYLAAATSFSGASCWSLPSLLSGST
ncbi:MAG: WD40 repeat domain-containing protein [Pirellulaceae bacterium]